MSLATGTGNGNGTEVKAADRLDMGQSVTQGDTGMGTGLFNMVLSYPLALGGGMVKPDQELLPPLPAYWSQARDRVLSQTVEYEGFWDIAVSIAVTKATAEAFEVEGANDLQARKGQELFNDHTNGGQGWANFCSPSVEDFLLTDKGTFIEIDRVDNSKPGAKVVGLYHLDSHRCYLTGSPDTPVIYWALDGTYHYLTWWQVFHISDRPNPRNNFFKVGRCAAARAYPRIRRMVAALEIDYQDMTGTKANTLELVVGVPPQQLDQLFITDKNNRITQQATVQGGVILGTLIGKDTVSHVTIKLRAKPEGWDQERELEHTSIWYADALGMDKADLKPFTGKMAGTATMSIIQHNKQQGKGLIVYKNGFEWFMSNHVLPTQASFHWIAEDMAQKKAEADLFKTWMDSMVAAVGKDATVLDHNQALQVLVDKNQLDRELLPGGQDITPGVTLEDDEKLLYPAEGGQAQPTATPAQPAPSPISQPVQQVRTEIKKKLQGV